MVSGGGTNLQALIDASKAGVINAHIAVVISSNSEAYALVRAQGAGIKTYVACKKNFLTLEERDCYILQILRGNNIDYVFMAGYLGIVGAEFVQEYPRRIVNIHPALLPKFGGQGMYGANVHKAVIAAKERITGATAHFVNEVVDGGEIIVQKTLAVLPDETPDSLQRRLLEVEHKLIVEVAKELCK